MQTNLVTGIFFFLLASAGLCQDFDPYSCTFRGFNLYGKVQVVERNPDLRVEIVSSFYDLVVDSNASWPSKCGEWMMVERGADFKVQFVRSGGDIKVKFARSWPGVPDSKKTSQKSKINSYNCSYKGKPLYGKVKIVESFPDIKVKVVTSFPDLKVEIVENFPNQCGKWQFVDHFPDLKIQFVESFEDIKIEFVKSFPGLR
jgi:hypothetical protein